MVPLPRSGYQKLIASAPCAAHYALALGAPPTAALDARKPSTIAAMPGRVGLAIVALAALAAPAHASTEDDARDAMARGVAALGTGDPARALTEFTLAIQLVPDAPVPHRYAGEALEQLGRWGEAVARYEAYLRIRPDARDADDVRTRLARIRTDHLE